MLLVSSLKANDASSPINAQCVLSVICFSTLIFLPSPCRVKVDQEQPLALRQLLWLEDKLFVGVCPGLLPTSSTLLMLHSAQDTDDTLAVRSAEQQLQFWIHSIELFNCHVFSQDSVQCYHVSGLRLKWTVLWSVWFTASSLAPWLYSWRMDRSGSCSGVSHKHSFSATELYVLLSGVLFEFY